VRSSERSRTDLLSMSRLTGIQKAIEELTPEEKEELRDWLDGHPATEREWAVSTALTNLSAVRS
jgi:hypothetical protein